VSFDTVDENRAFAEKMGFPYRLLCDTEREIGVAYGATAAGAGGGAKRISYLIGPDGTVRHAWAKVDPSTHAAEVLEKIG
jgi:thioredoxin-dependent peroxiredoxin